MTTECRATGRQGSQPARLAAQTYNAAADHFDDVALAFWERHGRYAVDLLDLDPGASVLDVGCGSGASALPAAARVGAAGSVLGMDVADRLLTLAKKKANRMQLRNTTFVNQDMAMIAPESECVDTVISVFSLFFVDDMHGLLRKLWSLVRPGGKLLVATWGADAFQPAGEVFAEEVALATGTQPRDANAWERLSNEDALRQLFADAGVPLPAVVFRHDRQQLRSPDDWWTIVLGSGFRGHLASLTEVERRALRVATLRRLRDERVASIDTSALHAVATKPSGVYRRRTRRTREVS